MRVDHILEAQRVQIEEITDGANRLGVPDPSTLTQVTGALFTSSRTCGNL